MSRRKGQSGSPGGSARPFWWGAGAPPLEQWPGVTIDIATTWSSARSRWESHGGQYYFDAAAADKICGFFPTFLKHHLGEFAGEPFHLLDYQSKLIVRPLWGWKRTADGYRRFTKNFDFLPKGNGKSPMGSGLAVYGARCDGEPAAEVYCVAADRDQARVVHDNAKIMVEGSEDLSENADVLRDAIYWTDSRSIIKVLSSDAATKHGFRPYIVIFDEIHAQKNRDLYEALSRSMVKRRQPLMIILTHAGVDDEGIGFEEYEYAKNVLTGANLDERCLPVLFEATVKDDWSDPAVARRVNPGYGITVKADGLAQLVVEAKAEPRKLNDLLMFNFNRWVNQAVAWMPVDWWDACGDLPDHLMPLDADLSTWGLGAGLDGAQKWDLMAFVLVFMQALPRAAALSVDIVAGDELHLAKRRTENLNYRIAVKPFFWIPEDTMREHQEQDHVPYDQWVKDGLVTATEGAVIDYDRIYHDIKEKIAPRFPKLKQATIGYDPAFTTDIALKLRDKAGFKIEEVLQNYKYLSEPCHIFEAFAKARRVHHDGHRVLRNHVENVAVKRDDAGRIRPVKPKKAAKHIDGVVGILNGLSMLSRMPSASGYNSGRPLRTF